MMDVHYLNHIGNHYGRNIYVYRFTFYIPSWFILLVISSIVIFRPDTVSADKASAANKQGIKAFNEQKYDESVEHFTEALVESPDTPELKFNRGTALSAAGKNEEAVGELKSSAARFENNEQSAAAHYNAGNALLASNNIEAAIQEYKQAVKLDQVPEDIRHNLELALRKLNQQKQSQEQQDKENSEENKEKEEDKESKQQKDQENKEEQDKQDEQQSDKTQSPEDGEQKDQNQQPSNQQQNEDKTMTQEEAKRLLDAINDEEKRALSQRYMQMKSDMRQGDDW